MSPIRALAAFVLVVAVTVLPAYAARQIVDLHRLDAYFALFASDSNVPWKPTTVRLDTYSSAPVQFSVYQVDPADVITAGANTRPRAVNVRSLHPVSSFSFTPPGGYQFQSNQIDVQLGSREGFFVVEARRGNVGEQVWINRTRVGLIAKGSAGELLLYGTDLGTGRALAHMRVELLAGGTLITTQTDDRGLVRWTRSPHPLFALAQWGGSYAFISILPQAPLPSSIVGVRVESAVVHAGDTVRVVGFARTRAGGSLRAATGHASITMRIGATMIAQQSAPLDAAGAFSTSIAIPPGAAAGDYAVLAQVGSGIGGASVHVDANAGGLSLEVAADCEERCDPRTPVPLTIHSSRGGIPVHVTVVRSPHVYVGYEPAVTPWGTTTWLDATVTTNADGTASVQVPHPSDDLASTYGVRVESGGATADTRVVVPTAKAAIRVTLDRDDETLGTPIGFDVDAVDVTTGAPLAGARVTMRLVHGVSTAQQTLTLDAQGHARGSFSAPQLGNNLVFASVDDGGRAVDAGQVQVEPQGLGGDDAGSGNVRLNLDRGSYRAGDWIGISASLSGAAGDALLSLESATGMQAVVAGSNNGNASARLRASDVPGILLAGAAFVRDGSIEWSTEPVALDAPGRAVAARVHLAQGHAAAGSVATIALGDAAPSGGTVVVRISRGQPSGSALFDSAPDLLAIAAATTQISAPSGVTWHPWVDSTGNHAQVLGFVRRSEQPQALAQADTQAISWDIVRASGGSVPVRMPAQPGRYTISVLTIFDDGRVSASSSTIVVQ
jgi:hypothetical protein